MSHCLAIDVAMCCCSSIPVAVVARPNLTYAAVDCCDVRATVLDLSADSNADCYDCYGVRVADEYVHAYDDCVMHLVDGDEFVSDAAGERPIADDDAAAAVRLQQRPPLDFDSSAAFRYPYCFSVYVCVFVCPPFSLLTVCSPVEHMRNLIN